MNLNPYLIFDGKCREAFEFYAQVFGSKIDMISTFGEAPPEMQVPEGEKDKVMHVSMQVGSTTLMGSDKFGNDPSGFRPGNNVHVSVNVEDADRARQIFEGLAQGGTVTMPMNETFWGALFGMAVDRFGIHWMVNCDLHKK